MRDELKKIKEAAIQALEEAKSMDYLNEQKVRFLGKKGELTTILKGMGKLSAEERPIVGQLANEARDEINQVLERKMAELKAAVQEAKLVSETLDVTLPGRALHHGTKHPITMVIEEAKQIFMGLGFEVAEGPEIESDYYNFEALNLPKDHPAVICRILSISIRKLCCAPKHRAYRYIPWRLSRVSCPLRLSAPEKYTAKMTMQPIRLCSIKLKGCW